MRHVFKKWKPMVLAVSVAGLSVLMAACDVGTSVPPEGTVAPPTVVGTISIPTVEATSEPEETPTADATGSPTAEATGSPTAEATGSPTAEATAEPTVEATVSPTAEPTESPTVEPTVEPTVTPTMEPVESPTAEPTESPTVEPIESPTPEPTGSPTVEPVESPTAEPTGTPSPEEGTVVQSSENADLGEILTDGDGMTLYVLDEDSEGDSTCYDTCSVIWPPLLLTNGDEPMAGEGADQDLLDTFERDDGTIQVMYNGMPLYYFGGDFAPGDVEGNDSENDWGTWNAVSPDGEPVSSIPPDEEEEVDGPVVQAVANAELEMEILTDAEGYTLYVLDADSENDSTCTSNDCVLEWPPFLVEEGEMPVAGDGVTSELLNTFERGDGTIQVSYNGMPLYYYRNDILPGEIFGHEEEDSAGGWSVVGP